MGWAGRRKFSDVPIGRNRHPNASRCCAQVAALSFLDTVAAYRTSEAVTSGRTADVCSLDGTEGGGERGKDNGELHGEC